MTTTVSQEHHGRLDAIVGRIAGFLRHGGGALTSGDVAALRRMDPRKLDAPFFKLAGLVLETELPAEPRALEDRETRWAAIVVGLAHLGDLHDVTTRLGGALALADFSEIRFSRLLRADVERLIDDLPSLARFLSAKGTRTNWAHAARLILSAGRADEESTRRMVARDYYVTLAKKNA